MRIIASRTFKPATESSNGSVTAKTRYLADGTLDATIKLTVHENNNATPPATAPAATAGGHATSTTVPTSPTQARQKTLSSNGTLSVNPAL